MSGQRTGAMSTPNENLLDPLLSSPITMLPGVSESRLRRDSDTSFTRIVSLQQTQSRHCVAAIL